MDIKYANGTEHDIYLYNLEDTVSVQKGRKLVLKEGAVPHTTIPKGTNLNATKANGELPEHLKDAPEFLKGAVKFTSAEPMPEGDYDVLVVSNLYRSACVELGRDTSHLGTIDGAVYQDETCTRPCGCLGIAVG